MGYQADNKVTERGTERYGEVREGKDCSLRRCS